MTDLTNTKDDSAVIKERPRKQLKKTKSATCISETPLFAPHPRLLKKGFKSTAVAEFVELTGIVSVFMIITGSLHSLNTIRGRHGRDRIVVGFITTYAISAHHH